MNNIEQRFPWSFLGVLISIIFGVFGIYTVFFYSRSPALELETINQAPVFSLREDVDGLDVMFQGKNIRETDQGLSLITVRISNQGSAPIRASDFDSKAPMVITVDKGEMVKVGLTDSSDEYFRTVFAEVKSNRSSIELPPFIMEAGKFMDIQTLVLHERLVAPVLAVSGKVADTGTLTIRPIQWEKAGASSISATSGDFRIQFLRVAIYGFGTVICTILVIAAAAQIAERASTWRYKRSKRKRFESLERHLLELDANSREKLLPLVALMKSSQSAMAEIIAEILFGIANSIPLRYSDNQIKALFKKADTISPGVSRLLSGMTPDLAESLYVLMDVWNPFWKSRDHMFFDNDYLGVTEKNENM